MYHTIENESLRLTVDSHGGQMQSLVGKSGQQYLWQGDPAYWSDRAPVLFPFIGRLEKKCYRLGQTVYPMGIHGFAAESEFTLHSRSTDTLVLTLSDSPQTRACYPFPFTLTLCYRLTGNTVEIQTTVKNCGSSPMHFALGGHPGFQVPFAADTCFTDYVLEFPVSCTPERIGFTADTVLLNGQNQPYPLENGTAIALHHGLFDRDAVILQHIPPQVTLKSEKTPRKITVCYPQMPYLGIWHWPNTDASYVCIEPWTSLPGRSGVTEEISCRSDFIHLPGGDTYENTWTITVTEE